ncbi:AAA family ATPase [Candidatus Uhrbacteria bacterium]|nr:AAA family ATPase [Candidatus Uhrbacteria bacterium]
MPSQRPPAPESMPPQRVKAEIGDTLHSIVFEMRNGQLRASSTNFKAMELEDAKSAETIQEGQAYDVVVVRDTRPEDPNKGKLVVRVIGLSSSGANVPQERWEGVQETVYAAEKQKRKAAKRSTEIGLLSELATGKPMTLAERLGLTTEEAIARFKADVEAREAAAGKSVREARRTAETSGETRRVQAAMVEEREARNAVTEALGPEGTATLENAFVSFQWTELSNALRKDRALDREREALVNPPSLSQSREEEAELKMRSIKRKLKGMGPTAASAEVAAEIGPALEQIDEKREQILQESPEAFFGLHLKDLKKYREQLDSGKIVETPYVERQALELEANVRRGQPVFIYGHLGSGKTELALHVAEKVLQKREDLVERDAKGKIVRDNRHALVISGSKYMAQSELYGHQVLAVDKMDKEAIRETVREVEEEFNAWKKENDDKKKNLSEDERIASEQLAHDRILQTYLTAKKGGTISDFYLGPVYQAMEDGRPIIIDEVNAIPHEVLISLNHALTRRPGDVINVQQDSGKQITVRDGFSVVMTGNLNVGTGETVQKYVNREKMDPAFISRLKLMEHDYLPQETAKPFRDQNGEVTPAAEGVDKELFTVMLAGLMDSSGNVEAPKDALPELWNLAMVARSTQDAFAGKRKAEFAQAGQKAFPVPVQYAVISIRGIKTVMDAWQSESYQKPLERVIFDTLIKDQPLPQERAWLYQQFQSAGFFNQTDGWKNASELTNVQTSFEVKPPKRKAEKIELEFNTPRDLIKVLYGDGPERERWPVLKSQEETEKESGSFNPEQAEQLAEYQEFLEKMEKEIADLSDLVDKHCAVEQRAAEVAV